MISRLVEEDHTTHVNTNYLLKSDDGAYIYIRFVCHLAAFHCRLIRLW